MKPCAKLGIALSTTFRLEKHNKNGDLTGEREFENVVLDIGWDALVARFQSSNMFPKYLYFGTGTTEPTEQDTGLENLSGTLPGKAYNQDAMGGSDYLQRLAQVRLRFQYAEGEAEGVWTELGLAYGSTYTEPYNRALIRDESGTPISFTILSDEYLTVYAYLNLYLVEPSPLPSGTLDYNGTTIDWAMRPITDTMARDNAYSKFENSWSSGTSNYYNNMWENQVVQQAFFFGVRASEGLVTPSGATDVTRVTGTNKFETKVLEYEPGDYDRELYGVTFLGSGSSSSSGIGGLVVVDFTPHIVVPKEHKMTVQKHSIEIFRAPVPTV